MLLSAAYIDALLRIDAADCTTMRPRQKNDDLSASNESGNWLTDEVWI